MKGGIIFGVSVVSREMNLQYLRGNGAIDVERSSRKVLALVVAAMGAGLLACLVAAILAEPGIAAPATPVDSNNPSGQKLYQERCASCHGIDAKGNGPVADVLKVPPPDLTGISERAGGVFPAARVVEIISFGGNMTAHGTQTMPVWGKILSLEGGRGRRGGVYSHRAVVELKRYLETIQKK